MATQDVTRTQQLPEDVSPLFRRVERTDEGFNVYVESKIIHGFFAGLAPKEGQQTTKVPRWANMEIFLINRIPAVPNVSFANPGEGIFLPEHIVNLSFLRSVELHRGVKLDVPGPIANPQLDNFCAALDRGALGLYMDWIRPFVDEARVTISRRTLI